MKKHEESRSSKKVHRALGTCRYVRRHDASIQVKLNYINLLAIFKDYIV